VTAHLADEHLNSGDCDVYLCGPPLMVEAVRSFFTQKGVNPAHFFYEKFSATEAVAA
jgi:benzoate/toluate 1,2-dioxygenase reductase subunit